MLTETSTDLLAIAASNPVALFTDDKQYSEFYARVKASVLNEGASTDTSTATARDEIKARAFKVTKAKTTLDKLALGLTEDWRTKTAAVNASRRKMVTELDALAAEVRKPVTDWEDAEKAREARVNDGLSWLRSAATVAFFDTSASLAERLAEVKAFAIGPDYGHSRDIAEAARAYAVETIETGIVRLAKEEADRAELDKLRAENEARLAREAEEAAAQAEVDRIAAEVAAVEKRKAEAAAAQAAAIQKAKDDAAAEAIAAERKAAQDAANEAQRIADAAIAAEKKRADDLAKAAAEVEAKAAADKAAADALAMENAKREKNRVHVSGVMTRAKEAIMRCGITEEQARVIVLAIKAGEIPAVKMEF